MLRINLHLKGLYVFYKYDLCNPQMLSILLRIMAHVHIEFKNLIVHCERTANVEIIYEMYDVVLLEHIAGKSNSFATIYEYHFGTKISRTS